MPATTFATPGLAGPGAFTRVTVTVVMAVIAALAFVFSFGNVWALALRLGIPRPIAPLIAPMVDLSVVGLLVALHHLILTGTGPAQLASAKRLMHLCGLLTVALNIADPLLTGHIGRAALDAVAPVLLLGWGVVGPDLLHHLASPTTRLSKDVAPDLRPVPPAVLDRPVPVPAASPVEPAPAVEPRTPANSTEPEQGPTPPLPPAADLTGPDAEPALAPDIEPDPEPAPVLVPTALPSVPAPLLAAGRRIADDHHVRTGTVITPAELRVRLGVPATLADAVHAHLAAVPA
ncbi:DUF2637 domain-containing protein [Kitasatospora sp. NPDC059673]|uniref:DUF2637 domain-containing protein n=1 Tax=Kitasatospora sp. NPDC059673 TaxID=3346901 RepID=UPI0036CB92CF